MNEKPKLATRLGVAPVLARVLALVLAIMLAAPVARPINASAKNTTQNILLVELFTSQGCSSCPPADEYFSELAENKKLAVLAWHVPYWNYIGWKDPFSSELAEKRQRQYAQKLHTNQIYTPQAVVAARKQYVGSDRRALGKSLRAEMKRNQNDKSAPQLILKQDSEGERNFSLNIKPAENKNNKKSEFKLSFVVFQSFANTDIKRGENRGKTLREANIVREVKKIGSWDGKAVKKFSFQLPKQKNGFDVLRDGGVVVIAEPNDLSGGVAATRWDFKRGFKPEQSS